MWYKHFLLFCILGVSCGKLDISCVQFSPNFVKTGTRTFNGSKNCPNVLITIWEDIQHHTNTWKENRQVPSKHFKPLVYKDLYTKMIFLIFALNIIIILKWFYIGSYTLKMLLTLQWCTEVGFTALVAIPMDSFLNQRNCKCKNIIF